MGSLVGNRGSHLGGATDFRRVITTRNVHLAVHGRAMRPSQSSVYFLKKTQRVVLE